MDGYGESERVMQPAVIEGRSMAVLYGSETGNAEDIAGELGKTSERLHFQTRVDEMDGFKLVCCLYASVTAMLLASNGLTMMQTGRSPPHITCRLCHLNNGTG